MATPSLAVVGGQLFPVGYPGQLANYSGNAKTETRVNSFATAINFGEAVCRGTAVSPGTIGGVVPMVSGGVVIGISVRALSEANTAVAAGTVNYPQFHDVPILKEGDIWCTAAENVTEGDIAIAVVAVPGAVGGLTGGAANGTTRLTVPGAVWQQTVLSGAVGLLRIVTP